MAGYASSTRIFCYLILSLAILLMGGLTTNQLEAQGIHFWNTADKQRPWVTEINPALTSFHQTEISLGLKAFQIGFLPNSSFGLRESRLNLSLPFYLPYGLAVGVDIRHFTAGIYSELSSALLLSKEIYPDFSVGIKTALDRRSFSKDEFNIIDPNDPLFNQSLATNVLNFGVGAYWQPYQWRLGLGVDHVNAPNIGLLNQSISPREISGAVGYKWGAITPTVLIHDNGVAWEYGFSMAFEKPDFGMLRLGYETTMPFKIEATLNLTKKTMLHYFFDLPGEGTQGISSGTQEFIYTQILAEKPVIGQPSILFSTPHLSIIHEREIRYMAPEIRLDALRKANEAIPEYLSSVKHDDDLLFIKAGALSEFETDEIKMQRHLTLIEKITEANYDNNRLQTVIWASQTSYEDAQALKYLLETKGRIPASNIKIAKWKQNGAPDFVGFVPGRRMLKKKPARPEKERLVIQFKVPTKTRSTEGWHFEIRDNQDRPVAQFEGKGNLPKYLAWDWHDLNGNLVQGGYYKGFLSVQATSEKVLEATSQTLPIYDVKRTVTFEIKPEPEQQITRQQQDADDVSDAE